MENIQASGLLLAGRALKEHRDYTTSTDLEDKWPSPWSRALQCAALTLVLKRPYEPRAY